MSGKIQANKDCPFCHGTGIAQYFDMTRMPEVGAGEHTGQYLCDNIGGEDVCPKCFKELASFN